VITEERYKILTDKKVVLDWSYSDLFNHAGKVPDYVNNLLTNKLNQEDGFDCILYINSISSEKK
jgi:hypothetical protein